MEKIRIGNMKILKLTKNFSIRTTPFIRFGFNVDCTFYAIELQLMWLFFRYRLNKTIDPEIYYYAPLYEEHNQRWGLFYERPYLGFGFIVDFNFKDIFISLGPFYAWYKLLGKKDET